MKIVKLLEEAVIERFKKNAIVDGIKSEITKTIEKKIFEKYRSISVFSNNLEYKLIGVETTIDDYYNRIQIESIYVYLKYICVSKLPKEKDERVKEAIKKYNENKSFPENKYKIALWGSVFYILTISEAINNDIKLNLNVEIE